MEIVPGSVIEINSSSISRLICCKHFLTNDLGKGTNSSGLLPTSDLIKANWTLSHFAFRVMEIDPGSGIKISSSSISGQICCKHFLPNGLGKGTNPSDLSSLSELITADCSLSPFAFRVMPIVQVVVSKLIRVQAPVTLLYALSH